MDRTEPPLIGWRAEAPAPAAPIRIAGISSRAQEEAERRMVGRPSPPRPEAPAWAKAAA